MNRLALHNDRFFDPDPGVRTIARELYQGVRDLPIVSPHGHVDPRLFATNEPFPDPAALIIIPDHYVFRMLYSQGIPLESLGVPRIDGGRNSGCDPAPPIHVGVTVSSGTMMRFSSFMRRSSLTIVPPLTITL